jgi:hypothetical protein
MWVDGGVVGRGAAVAGSAVAWVRVGKRVGASASIDGGASGGESHRGGGGTTGTRSGLGVGLLVGCFGASRVEK